MASNTDSDVVDIKERYTEAGEESVLSEAACGQPEHALVRIDLTGLRNAPHSSFIYKVLLSSQVPMRASVNVCECE